MSHTWESPPTKLFSDSLSPEPLSSLSQEQSSLSQEQRERMEEKKLEAQARRIAKRFGAEEIGVSWVKALFAEFKKPYIQEVSRTWKAKTNIEEFWAISGLVYSMSVCTRDRGVTMKFCVVW